MDVIYQLINLIFGTNYGESAMPRQIFILWCITETLREGYTDPEQIAQIAAQYGNSRNITAEEVYMCLNWQLLDFTAAG